jgi:hypothetical protein
MARYHIHPTAKIGELANRQVLELTTGLTHMKIENDLRREVLDNIRRLKDIGTYRGRRHAMACQFEARAQGPMYVAVLSVAGTFQLLFPEPLCSKASSIIPLLCC